MRDYAGNYRVKPQRQVASARSRGRLAIQPLRALFWKTAGGVVVFAMCTGVVASFWIGQHIQDRLSSIATLQTTMNLDQRQQQLLVGERDRLLATDRMIAKAAVQHGLYVDMVNKQHVKLQD